jgi:hypothetical protein
MNPKVSRNIYYTVLGFLVEVGGFVYLLVLIHGGIDYLFNRGPNKIYSEYSWFMAGKLKTQMEESLQERLSRIENVE